MDRSLVEQLECMGFWHWVIYVALWAVKRPARAGAEAGALYDYHAMAYSILQRNVYRPVPEGSCWLPSAQQHLNDLRFADLMDVEAA